MVEKSFSQAVAGRVVDRYSLLHVVDALDDEVSRGWESENGLASVVT